VYTHEYLIAVYFNHTEIRRYRERIKKGGLYHILANGSTAFKGIGKRQQCASSEVGIKNVRMGKAVLLLFESA